MFTLNLKPLGSFPAMGFMLVTAPPVEAQTVDPLTVEVIPAPFGVGPGQYVEFSTNNPCPRAAVVSLSLLDSGEVLIDDVSVAAQRETTSTTYFEPNGATVRTKIAARLRIRCQGNLGRNAMKEVRARTCAAIEIVDAITEAIVQSFAMTDEGCLL